MHDIDPRQVVAELLNTVAVDTSRSVGPTKRGEKAEAEPGRAAAVQRDASGSPAR
jgi:hypothetical protein